MQVVQHPFSMSVDPDTKMPQLPGFDERQQLANAMAGQATRLCSAVTPVIGADQLAVVLLVSPWHNLQMPSRVTRHLCNPVKACEDCPITVMASVKHAEG